MAIKAIEKRSRRKGREAGSEPAGFHDLYLLRSGIFVFGGGGGGMRLHPYEERSQPGVLLPGFFVEGSGQCGDREEIHWI